MERKNLTELLGTRRPPFVAAAVIVPLITLAVFRLPESFIAQLENSGPFELLTQRGWAFRLLALFAIVQAFYVGFSILRIDRVKDAREKDPRVATFPRQRIMRSLGINAAVTILLTVVYGLAALGLTGFRAGFWLFASLAVAQGAWYYQETGAIARWLDFQPETAIERKPPGLWIPEPPDYCPPLTRGLLTETKAPEARASG